MGFPTTPPPHPPMMVAEHAKVLEYLRDKGSICRIVC